MSTFGKLLFGVLITCTLACKKKDEVDPSGIKTPPSPPEFSDVFRATGEVMKVYAPLSGVGAYGKELSLYFPYDTDEGNVSGSVDAGRRGIGKYQLTSTNFEIDGPWDSLYSVINRANICIKQIPLMSQFHNGTVAEQAELRRMYGEVLTLRAQSYFELIRNWGDVPLFLTPSDTIFIKVKGDVIYDTLLANLKLASDLVPWRTAVTRDARITKGAVKGLRAKIALFRAGYSLRTNMVMQQGSNRAYYLQITRDECFDIMNSGQHGLNSSFKDLFKEYVCGLQFDPAGEILFEIEHSGGNSKDDSQLGYYSGGRSTNSTYGQSLGGLLTNGVYFYSFDSTDTRKDVTIGIYAIGLNSYDLKSLEKLSNSIRLAKFRRDWLPVPIPGATQYLGINWPLIRYSDILLMFAEAENELNGGPTALAINAFELVRRRAYLGNESNIGATPTSYQGFFDAIVNERLLEFGGEGIRKYDLIRWNLLGTKLAEVKMKLNDLYNGIGAYANYPLYMYWENNGNEIKYNSSFYKPDNAIIPSGTKTEWRYSLRPPVSGPNVAINAIGEYYVSNTNDEIFPIPASAISAHPALTQDYGY